MSNMKGSANASCRLGPQTVHSDWSKPIEIENAQILRENAFGTIFANCVCFPIQEGRPKCIWQIQHQRRAILTAFAASWPNRAVSPGDTRSPVTARLDQVRPFRRPHIRWFCWQIVLNKQVASNQFGLLVHQVICPRHSLPLAIVATLSKQSLKSFMSC